MRTTRVFFRPPSPRSPPEGEGVLQGGVRSRPSPPILLKFRSDSGGISVQIEEANGQNLPF